MRRLVHRVDRKNTQRPADRGLDPDSRGTLHQAQEKLHGMLAQPLALPCQPITEVTIPEGKTVQQICPIERGGLLQRCRCILCDGRFEGGKIGFDYLRRKADRAAIRLKERSGPPGRGE